MREALRRMEREENGYLNPPPLTAAEAKQCFASRPSEDDKEHALVLTAEKSRRRRIRRRHHTFDDLPLIGRGPS